MEVKKKGNIEGILKEAAYDVDINEFNKVWCGFKNKKEKNREVFGMKEKKKGLSIIVWIASFMAIAGLTFFALTKIGEAKRNEKLMSGEAILVTFVVGDVQINKNASASFRPLYVDDTIEMGDSIRTGSGSFCEIQMIGRGVFRIEESSELEIARLINVDNKIESRMKLGKGEVALSPRRTERGDTFEVETSVAVAAVRGTRFSVSSDDDGNFNVAVAEGRVDVRPNIASINKAKEEGLISEDAVDVLAEELIAPVSVNHGEEITLGKAEVEIMDNAIGSAIKDTVQSEGPITIERLTTDSDEVEINITKKITVKTRENVNREIEIRMEEAKSEGRENEVVYLTRVSVAVSPEKSDRIETSSIISKTQISEKRLNRLGNVTQDRLITDLVDLVRFRIESDPRGANVYLDNELVGVTPFSRNALKGTAFDIRLTKDGFEDIRKVYEADTMVAVVRESLVKIPVQPVAEEVTPEEDALEEIIVDADIAESEDAEISEEPRIMPGDLQWNKPLRFTRDIKTPVVYRNRVYTTSQGNLYILSFDGTIHNRVAVASGRSLSAPVISDNIVYIGSDKGGIYAYSLGGEKIWSSEDAGIMLYDTSPGAGFGIVAAPSTDKGIKIFNKDGKLIGSIEMRDQLFSSPAIVGNGKTLVYATERGEVLGYDIENGKELWKNELYNTRIVFPVMSGNNVVAVFDRNSGILTGLNPANGTIVWKRELEGASRTRISPVNVDGRILIVDANETKLFVVNINNGALLLSKTYRNISSHPYYGSANNTVYVGTATGQLYAYNLSSSAEWSGSTGQPITLVAGDKDSAYAVTENSMIKFYGEQE